MRFFRAFFSGILVWIAVSFSFYVLEKVYFLEESFLWQSILTTIFIVFFAIGAAKFYYLKKYNMSGLQLGIIMSATALILDVFITVPYVEIPNGRSYESFFTSPVLWILAFTNAFTVYIWKKKQDIKKTPV
ncbi:DUF5367 family protein [Flavobacterium plurextorum]|uniref:DUF5367 family protein n=1 Tax=Flavobacterium TaxID=237 RepID=UPI002FC706AB